MAQWDSLWIDGHLATMVPGTAAYGAIRDGALAVQDGRIAWLGPRRELPGEPARCAATVHSLGGGWLTPGLIDCHTHLVFAGSRVHEFEARHGSHGSQGYEDAARRGGGILATVAATRGASPATLMAGARTRLQALLAGGVTTVEVKSGYGLDLDTERRLLQVARALGRETGMGIRCTFLGAHALPAGYAGRPDDYISFLCDTVLPALAAEGLVDAVDAFHERIGFSTAQVERLFARARELGLPVKLHADQLSEGGGAQLAARCGALSADHLEYSSEAGAAALAAAGSVAVLLPGAFHTLGETRVPPIDAFRRHGVPMAIATDCNPGSSPALSLPLMMNFACLRFGLTPGECLAGVTRCAARALGLGDRGTLAPGQRADLAAWDIGTPAELSYWLGYHPLRQAVIGGRPVTLH